MGPSFRCTLPTGLISSDTGTTMDLESKFEERIDAKRKAKEERKRTSIPGLPPSELSGTEPKSKKEIAEENGVPLCSAERFITPLYEVPWSRIRDLRLEVLLDIGEETYPLSDESLQMAYEWNKLVDQHKDDLAAGVCPTTVFKAKVRRDDTTLVFVGRESWKDAYEVTGYFNRRPWVQTCEDASDVPGLVVDCLQWKVERFEDIRPTTDLCRDALDRASF